MANTYEIIPIPGYNTKSRQLLLINNTPTCICNGKARVQKLIGYVEGTVSREEIHDKKILGYLDKYKKR